MTEEVVGDFVALATLLPRTSDFFLSKRGALAWCFMWHLVLGRCFCLDHPKDCVIPCRKTSSNNLPDVLVYLHISHKGFPSTLSSSENYILLTSLGSSFSALVVLLLGSIFFICAQVHFKELHSTSLIKFCVLLLPWNTELFNIKMAFLVCLEWQIQNFILTCSFLPFLFPFYRTLSLDFKETNCC